MPLSHVARMHAAEIRNHDWSDAPFRIDRAGHDRAFDGGRGRQLSEEETDRIRTNVMWVTAQVLGYQDPNFDVYEFAAACGVEVMTRSGRLNGGIEAGVRLHNGRYMHPGTWDAAEGDWLDEVDARDLR